MSINRSFILILNVLFVYASVFLERRPPIYTQLCSSSKEGKLCLAAGSLGEVGLGMTNCQT